jgi:hypothetical protein
VRVDRALDDGAWLGCEGRAGASEARRPCRDDLGSCASLTPPAQPVSIADGGENCPPSGTTAIDDTLHQCSLDEPAGEKSSPLGS